MGCLRLCICCALLCNLAFLLNSCYTSSLYSPRQYGPPKTVEFYYDQLRIKDRKEMRDLILPYIRRARGDIVDNADEREPSQLMDVAILIAFSRPNVDTTLFRLTSELKHNADVYGSFEGSLHKMSQKGVSNIIDTSLHVRERATWYFILENIVNYCRVSTDASTTTCKKILNDISMAKIRFSSELESHLYLQALRSNAQSPSEQARKVLENMNNE